MLWMWGLPYLLKRLHHFFFTCHTWLVWLKPHYFEFYEKNHGCRRINNVWTGIFTERPVWNWKTWVCGHLQGAPHEFKAIYSKLVGALSSVNHRGLHQGWQFKAKVKICQDDVENLDKPYRWASLFSPLPPPSSFSQREARHVWCLPPVWNLRVVIWFHFTISCFCAWSRYSFCVTFFLPAGPFLWTFSRKFCNIFR